MEGKIMMPVAEQKGWNQVGFNDSHWHPVVVQEAPKGVLRPQMGTSGEDYGTV